MKEIEIWKDIPEYEKLYQISNFGRVKSLNYRRSGKENILKPVKNNKGYLFVDLYKNGKRKSFRIHQLVALTFIPNSEKLPIINHKNEIKHDNRVENLEWCDNYYNLHYGTCQERKSKKMKGIVRSEEAKRKMIGEKNPFYGKHHTEKTKDKIRKKMQKPIIQYTIDNKFVKEWESAKSASIELNLNSGHITECCKGKLKKTGGFIWKYKEYFILKIK